jgi:hypothetical protein
VQELPAERIVKEALRGKFHLAKELLDRVEGRVVEQTRIEGPTGPIMIKIAPPKVIGQPDADARAQAEFEEELQQSKREHPRSVHVAGDCWPE